MIGVAEKEKEQYNAERHQHQSVRLRLAFWEKVLTALEESGVSLFANVNPGKDHWLSTGSGTSGIHYTMVFAKKEVRVVLNMERPRKEENKWMFDRFLEERDAIEKEFGAKLEWMRKDRVKASRIRYRKVFDGFDSENWPEMIAWFVDYLPRLEKAFASRLKEIGKELKNVDFKEIEG